MSVNYYYTGTDYSSMHPFHWDFWIHMFWPWDGLNWCWLVCLVLVLWVRFNDKLIEGRMNE